MDNTFKPNHEMFSKDITILHTTNCNIAKILLDFSSEIDLITTEDFSNIDDIPLKILGELGLLNLVSKKELTKIDEITINILKSLVSSKSIIVFYDVLPYINSTLKEQIILKLHKQNKIIINYTSEIEETLMLDYIIVLNNNKIIMEGPTKSVLSEEKIIKKLGFNLPIVVELSLGLKYYGVVNKIFYNSKELVEELWK